MKVQRGRLLLRSLSLAVLLAFSAAEALLAQNWCNNPVPTPSPTPRPTPPPPCEPTDCPKCKKSPCYVGSGAYQTKANDLTIRTAGFPLRAGRSYQSAIAIDGPLGFGWTSSLVVRLFYAVYLFSAPSTYQKEADVVMPDGARYVFKDAGGGVFTAPTGRYDTLIQNGDQTFDLTLQRSRSTLHFSATGGLSTMTDDFGNVIQWNYDANGRLQRVQDNAGSGRYLDVFWGADGRISSVRDTSGRQVQYSYNTSGALATVIDAASRTVTYSYHQGRFSPLLSRITDPWGRITTDVAYDSADRVQSYTDSGETYTYTYAYGGNPGVTAKTDSQGNRYIYPFNSVGLVTDSTPPAGGAGPTHTDYYPDGSVQQFIDAVGVKSLYTYTSNGSLLTATMDYQGPSTIRFDYTYDPAFPWRVTSITPRNPSTNVIDPNWIAWKYDYYQPSDPAPGSLHHVYRVHNDGVSLDTLATYAYDSHGRLTRQTSATGAVTDFVYDASGNLQTMTRPSNNDAATRPVTTYGYDTLGRVTSVTDPLNHATLYGYDNLDRLTSLTFPKPSSSSTLNFVSAASYDNFDAASGLVFTNLTDPNGRVTRQGYDQFGRLARSIDPATNTTNYGYAHGLLVSITDPNGNATGYAYDSTRRQTSTTFPDGSVERYTYWPDSLIYQRTDRKNQTVTFNYDHLKRPSSKVLASGTVSYTYLGQRLSQVVDASVSPTETHSVTYDASYRTASSTEGPRGTISYQYAADDSLANYAVQSGPSATYTYYPDGSLDTIQWSPVAGQFKYTYSSLGQYQSVTFPNGQTRNLAYDDQGRLTQIANAAPGGATIATYAYGYDLNYTTGQYTMLGQRVSTTATVPSQGLNNHLFKYEYDALYELNKVTYPNVAPLSGEVDSWTYDAIGNRVSSTVNGATQSYSYQKVGANPNNWQRMLSDGVNGYTYDGNGDMATAGGLTLTWDQQDHLASLSGSVTAAYGYDYHGRRRSKTTGGISYGYLYDGLNMIQEQSSSNADFLFGPGMDEPLAMRRNGQIYYYAVDGLGSVVGVTNASGTVQNAYLYDAWGQLRNQTGSLANPFTYTARELGEGGTWFYRARYYQPSVGRFVSEDPIRRRRPYSVNALYLYGRSSPTAFIDPLGLDECTTLFGYGPWQLLSEDWYQSDWELEDSHTEGSQEEGEPIYQPPPGNQTKPKPGGGNAGGVFWVVQQCHWVKYFIDVTVWMRDVTVSVHCECPPRTFVSHSTETRTATDRVKDGDAWTSGGMVLGFIRPCPKPGQPWQRPVGYFDP